MLLDIATEELSHLKMVAQSLHLLLKDSPAELVDQVEGNYLGDLLNGKMPDYVSMSLNSGPNLLGGGGPRLTDSMGAPWTAAYVDTIGQPAADLRSDIAAEARAKITYERLIKLCDDAGLQDTLNFLMSDPGALRSSVVVENVSVPGLGWVVAGSGARVGEGAGFPGVLR